MARRHMKPGDVYLIRNVTDVQVSPDGSRVAYVVARFDRDSDAAQTSIWVTRGDGRGKPRPLTSGTKDSSPRWSPDGSRLAFVADRGELTQVFVMPLDGGEAKAITSSPHGASQPAWSPDGRSIAFVARTGDWKNPKDRTAVEKSAPRVVTTLYWRLDNVGPFDERRSHVFVVDVESGQTRQLTKGDWNDQQPAWSPNGRTIAFASDRSRSRFDHLWRGDVWTVAARGGAAKRITRGLGLAAYPAWSPDGKSIAFVGHQDADEHYEKNTKVFVVRSTGGSAPRSVSDKLDRSAIGAPIAPGTPLAWTARSDAVYFAAMDHGAMPLFKASVRTGAITAIGSRRVQVDSFSLFPDGRSLGVASAAIDRPGDVFVVPAGDGKERNISRANEELARTVALSPVRRITHKASDGLEIESFVVRPPSYKPGRRYPLVLEIHGGPHGMHPNALALHATQTLAAAGYIVLLPNPRGSNGYGEEFTAGCVRDWGGADYEDLMGAVDAMVDSGEADADKLYVSGYSYGGFMTSWVVGHTRRFKAAVVGAPVVNLESMLGTSDIPRFSVYEIGGTPWTHPDEYRKHSPISYLEDIRTPVMLLHWDGDLRCPPGQSDELYIGLKLLGRKVAMVRYPGGSHISRTPSQAKDRIERALGWYREHARG